VLNVPLAAGSDDAAYRAAFRAEVEPFVARFEPDLVVVSAGFDAYRLDPLAGMELTAAGFHALAAGCARLAPRLAGVLEGGYVAEALPDLVAAAIDGFDAGR
jgi:acetoin utilization deacetylase AcuC-like enzyme